MKSVRKRKDQKTTNLRKAGPKSRMTKREAGRMTKQAAALPLYAPHSMAAPPAAEGEGDCGGGVILKAASLVVRQRSRVDAAAAPQCHVTRSGYIEPFLSD